MLEIISISGLINATVAISFGVLVISKNWKAKSNLLFFVMTFLLAIWAISYWQWLNSTNFSDAIYWVRVLSIGSVFIPISFLHWVLVILRKEIKHRILILGGYVASVFISLFALSPLFIEGVNQKLFFPFWPIPGILYSLYFFFIYNGLILYTLFLLTKTFFTTKDKSLKGQVLYILMGAILGFGGGLTNFFLWYDILIPPYGNFLVAAFPFLLGYSALKHHLFSLKTIATEILVFFIAVILAIQAILSQSVVEGILRTGFFFAFAALGYLLIKSVYREVEAREEIEKLAKDLALANERLKELDQLKSEFVSIASHQIRSPLTAIKGYASLILDGSYGMVPKAIHEAVDKIFASAQHLVLVVEDFLNVSRIEQGRMKYDFVEADLEKLVVEVIDSLKPSVLRANLEISFSKEGSGPFHSKIDVGKIQQVVTNLIDNSIKYTPKGSIKISLSSDGTANKICVKDTGVGIDEETLGTLFDKFTRAKDASKTNVSGTGLGLYVAREMVKAHGGRIWAESPGRGKGSSFFVELRKSS